MITLLSAADALDASVTAWSVAESTATPNTTAAVVPLIPTCCVPFVCTCLVCSDLSFVSSLHSLVVCCQTTFCFRGEDNNDMFAKFMDVEFKLTCPSDVHVTSKGKSLV